MQDVIFISFYLLRSICDNYNKIPFKQNKMFLFNAKAKNIFHVFKWKCFTSFYFLEPKICNKLTFSVF